MSPARSLRRPQRLRSVCLAVMASVSLSIWDLGSSCPYTVRAQEDQLAPLTDIKAIRALTPESADRHRRTLIRGTITYINEREPAGIIVHDGSSGLFVHYGRQYLLTHPRIDLHPGNVVEVEGHTTGEGFAPAVIPESIRRLGRSVLPPAKHVPYAALLSGVFDCEYIQVVGVGQRAWVSESGKTLFVDVAVEGGEVRAWFWDFSPQDLTRFIDARVRLRGNAGTLFNQARQVRGVALFAGRTDDAVIDTSAPDPWSLPVRAISSLYTHHAMDQLDRRVRLRGTVTGARVGQPTLVEDITMRSRSQDVRHKIYVRDQTSAALIETEQSFELIPGDVIDVVGFPIVSSTKPRLHNAVIRRVRHDAVPAPRIPARETLLTAGHDSELVRIDAVLLADVTTPAGRSLVLKAGDTVFQADHDPRSSVPTTGLGSGTLVSVTGIYVLDSGPPPAFRLLLRSANDVVLVAAPAWWTTRHSLVLGIVVAVTGLAGLVWARVIANRHAIVRQQYRAIIAERSRLASELHDTLEQGLAGIQLQLGAVARSLDGSPPNARRALGIASEMLRYSLSEARRSIMDLRHGALETRDLVGALSDVAHQMTAGTSLDATVRTIGAVRPLESSDEHHLLRIGLEALTNTIKHSGATRVDVALRFDADAVHLVVTDDGTGFTNTRFDHVGGHFGLRGIRERVDKIGGTLTIENGPGGGAVVAVSVPAAIRPEPRSETRHGQ
jgi:signal transduction histidine kinase